MSIASEELWLEHITIMMQSQNDILGDLISVLKSETEEIEILARGEMEKHFNALSCRKDCQNYFSKQDLMDIIRGVISNLNSEKNEVELDKLLEFFRVKDMQVDSVDIEVETEGNKYRNSFLIQGKPNLNYLLSKKVAPEDLGGLCRCFLGGVDFYYEVLQKIRMLFDSKHSISNQQFYDQILFELNQYKIIQFQVERVLWGAKCKAEKFISKRSYRTKEIKRILKSRIAQDIGKQITKIRVMQSFINYKKERDEDPTLEKFYERLMREVTNDKGKKISEKTAQRYTQLVGFYNKSIFLSCYRS